MKTINILLVLQNAYGYGSHLSKSTYTPRSCNRKNATYSRILPYLEPHFNIYFTECTRILANNSKDKFPTDYEFLKDAISSKKWDYIITFGKQAEDAFTVLNVKTHAALPHPTSFKWRKVMIESLRDSLLEKHDTDNKK